MKSGKALVSKHNLLVVLLSMLMKKSNNMIIINTVIINIARLAKNYNKPQPSISMIE